MQDPEVMTKLGKKFQDVMKVRASFGSFCWKEGEKKKKDVVLLEEGQTSTARSVTKTLIQREPKAPRRGPLPSKPPP